MSDTGSNDPNDPYRPKPENEDGPPPPPQAPRWGSNPPDQPQQPDQQQYGQPQYGQQYPQQYGQPAGSPPPNYLVWAILSTLFCCLPLGIPSIVFAAQVNSKYANGDVAGAMESSAKAKKFAIWSAIAGVIVSGLYITLVVVATGSST